MSNLIDIQKQIEKLQKQAQDIKAKESDRTVADIITKMQAFGISIKDLQLATVKGKGNAKGQGKGPVKLTRISTKSVKAATQSVPVKFRGPNGETWSGRGLTPRWLSALLGQGRTRDEFSVGS